MAEYKIGDKVVVNSPLLKIKDELGVVRTVYEHSKFTYYLVDIPYKTGKRVVCIGGAQLTHA
jgi:hypothetical protein